MENKAAASKRLDTWKMIAAYLGHHERTVKRWEAERALPIHRLRGDRRSGVFAYTDELDHWLADAESEADDETLLNHRFETEEIPLASTGDISPLEMERPQTPVLVPDQKRPEHFRKNRMPYAAAGLFACALILWLRHEFVTSWSALNSFRIADTRQLTSNGEEKQGLVTDGTNLYFAQELDGRFALVSMPVNGGAIQTMWAPEANVMPVDVSQDGKKLLVTKAFGVERERELWVVPLNGGKPHRISNITAQSAAWSPDCRSIAFSNGNAVYLATENDSTPKQIGSFPALPYALIWSHDGKAIRFLLVDSATNAAEFWGELSGNDWKTATQRPFPLAIEWDQGWIRGEGVDNYISPGTDRSYGSTPLWLIHYGQRSWEPPLKVMPMASIPVNSAGLAFALQPARLFALSELEIRPVFLRFDPGKGGFRQILPGISGVYIDYSRSGDRVAYVRFGDNSLWVSKTNGEDAKRLTDSGESVQLPRWSPDGNQLAFMTKRPGNPWRIHLVNLADGKEREASQGTDSQGAPTWSPDGRALVYGSVNCEEARTCAIHRIDLTTGNVETLPGSDGLSTARWSPDGRYVAALRLEQHELLLFDMNSRRWARLADAINGSDLSWSSDSRYLYSNIPKTDPRIIRIRVPDGKQETVLDLRSVDKFNVAESDDLLFSLAYDDALILHRRIHSQEIYAYSLRSQ